MNDCGRESNYSNSPFLLGNSVRQKNCLFLPQIKDTLNSLFYLQHKTEV